MAVLAKDRTISKAEYLNTAYKIQAESFQIYSVLTDKLKEFIGREISRTAQELINRVIEVESIYMKSASISELHYRDFLILDAIGKVKTLDANITMVYNILLEHNGEKGTKQHLPSDNIIKDFGNNLKIEEKLLKSILDKNREEIKRAQSGGFGKGKRVVEEENNYNWAPLILNVMRMKNEIYALQNDLIYDEKTNSYSSR